MSSFKDQLERASTWVDSRPDWLKPALMAPAFLLAMITARAGVVGLLVVLPVAIVGLLFQSETPFHDLALGAGLIGLLFLAAAVSGLVYSLLGRPLRRVPWIGPYLAGIVSVVPYLGAVDLLVRASHHEPILAPFHRLDWFSLTFTALLFGCGLGYVFLSDDGADDEDAERQGAGAGEEHDRRESDAARRRFALIRRRRRLRPGRRHAG